MDFVLGASFPVFLGLTLVMFGLASFLTGQALAASWRPVWQAVPYAVLLAAADRFLTFALFDGPLLAGIPYLLDLAVVLAVSLTAHRLSLAQKMVAQYPWLYERAGLFGWRERGQIP